MTEVITGTGLDFDDILNEALLEGALASGRSMGQIVRQFGGPAAIAAGYNGGRPANVTLSNTWTTADQAYLEQWAGVLSDVQLGQQLGRSPVAIKIRRKRSGLPSPTTHEDYVTANIVSRKLGVCVKAVCKWIDRGYMKADPAPLADRLVWRMRRSYFYAWALNPDNWILFYRSIRNPSRIRDTKLRQLILRRAEQWGDEWWTAGEVAKYHRVEQQDINRYIHAGKLPAVRWNNWMVRRSDATNPNLIFYKGKGSDAFNRNSTARRDAFIVLAVAVGLPYQQISNMMSRGGSWSHTTTYVRHSNIARRGLISEIIEQHGLPVRYRESDGATWADWRTCGHRFTLIEQAMKKWFQGELISRHERYALGGMLRSAVVWVEGADSPIARALLNVGFPGEVLLRKAMDVYQVLIDEVDNESEEKYDGPGSSAED